MSLQTDCWQEEIPVEVAEIGQAILDEEDPYRLIGDEVQEVLSLEDFAHLYSEEGRGAICPIILGLVVIFQFLENIPDREAAKWARVRLDWKYALHVPLRWKGFHYSTLSNFRRRLLEQGEERLLFEKVLAWIRGHGLLKKQGKQRTDSTHVLGQVAKLSRLELLWETLRVTLRAMERVGPGWYEKRIPAAFHEAYSERQHDWQLNKAEVQQATKQAGQDGFWLIDQIEEDAPEQVKALAEVTTLRRVWEQTFIRGGGQGSGGGSQVRLRPSQRGKRKEVIPSPHEPEARWSEKRGKEWIGYKLQVTETVERQAGQTFLTDIDICAANEDDSEAVEGIQERLTASGVAPSEQIVDAGYVSGGNLAHSQRRGIELIGPALADTSGKPEGYQQQDFTIDWEQERVTCPQGATSIAWYPRQDEEKQGIYIRFGSQCRECPVKQMCAPGKHGRTLFLNAYYEHLAERRAQQKTPAFAQKLKQRSAIEGTLSMLVRKHGARRARYRGRNKVRLQYALTGAAVNVKYLARALHHRRQAIARQQVVPT